MLMILTLHFKLLAIGANYHNILTGGLKNIVGYFDTVIGTDIDWKDEIVWAGNSLCRYVQTN